MSHRSIRYSEPTSRAFARMKMILFQPFDAGKWFVLGFTAWLATLFDGGRSGGSGGSDSSWGDIGTSDDEEDASTPEDPTTLEDPASVEESSSDAGELIPAETIETGKELLAKAWEWTNENWIIVGAVGALAAFIIVICVVLFWVSCRGKFMFLDNVVWNRALVVAPWKKFRAQGNSLFWWNIGFGIVTTILILLIAGGTGWALYATVAEGNWTVTATMIVLVGGLLMLGFFVFLFYIMTMLEDFVIPLMHRDSITTSVAWRRFLSLHNGRFFSFVLYAAWKFVLLIFSVFIIIAFALGTCCIGLFLIVIPYIGAVVTLPMTVFFRSLGPEFMRQFGDEWNVLDPV